MLVLGEGWVYVLEVEDLVIYIYGNGVLMVLCVVWVIE